jgi:hypothetical protein
LLIDLLTSLDSADPLFPKTTRSLTLFPTPAIAWLLEMSSPLQILQNSVLEHQSFEKANRPFHTPLSDSHLQRAAARCVPAVRRRCIPTRPTSKRHARLPGDATGLDGAAYPENKSAARLGSSRRRKERQTV